MREWGESNGKLLHLFIPSKTATLVPEFAMEDLPLGRIAALMPELQLSWHDLSLQIYEVTGWQLHSTTIHEVGYCITFKIVLVAKQ